MAGTAYIKRRTWSLTFIGRLGRLAGFILAAILIKTGHG
jgi:hypothetical protein